MMGIRAAMMRSIRVTAPFHESQSMKIECIVLERPCPGEVLVKVNAPDINEANRPFRLALEGWRREHPKLAASAEENLAESFAVFALPPGRRVRMRTTNGAERLNKKIKSRTRVATLFPNSASCVRLVSAILTEQNEQWMIAKIHLNMTL